MTSDPDFGATVRHADEGSSGRLSKVGVIRNLRRVAQEKILLAEQHRKVEIEFENASRTASPEGEGVALARVKY